MQPRYYPLIYSILVTASMSALAVSNEKNVAEMPAHSTGEYFFYDILFEGNDIGDVRIGIEPRDNGGYVIFEQSRLHLAQMRRMDDQLWAFTPEIKKLNQQEVVNTGRYKIEF